MQHSLFHLLELCHERRQTLHQEALRVHLVRLCHKEQPRIHQRTLYQVGAWLVSAGEWLKQRNDWMAAPRLS
jgi:hypothetical protein